jgi:hypothetical protein
MSGAIENREDQAAENNDNVAAKRRKNAAHSVSSGERRGRVKKPRRGERNTFTIQNVLITKHEVTMAEPTYEELKAKLSQLEKEVETKKRSGDLIFKVGEKGGVSVYGLGRFPVTLYYEQWNRLLGATNEIKAFMEENKPKLKLKDQS